MPTKDELRTTLQSRLDSTLARVNMALRGRGLKSLAPTLKRIGRGGRTPHWFDRLRQDGTLPNLDGKTIGSVVEMILVAVLETETYKGMSIPPLRINPARGIDLPDLELGVKSPSENFCTSEPFFSAYERLHGSDHDVLVLLTDYQQAKATPPLRLQIKHWKYLTKTQIADEGLCRIARGCREWLLVQNVAWAQKVFRFLAYVNQSDWRAKRLVRLVDAIQDNRRIRVEVDDAKRDFDKQNARRGTRQLVPIPDAEIESLRRILTVKPLHLGVIDAADNWVVETHKDFGRMPNDNEWHRLESGPLDGAIGMSFALQWRYNFARLFGVVNGTA